MPTTRIAKLDDLNGILDITNWAIRKTPSNFNDQPQTLDELAVIWQRTQEHYPWLVATECDNVLAFANASPYKARAAYRWTAEVSVYVSPEHQGKGIGRTLQSALIPILEAQGYRTLVAAIALPNAPSVRLHESLGFTHWGTLERAGWKFGTWHDVGYWRRTVTGGMDDTHPPKSVQEATGEAAST